ncbi:hypothetical protein CHS0354_007229 [Potamilus streckersoni]|uniref:Farnesoic acid O-methyl transferase domain-containing protein n=1 Tax=Potamilus streckersoni TaxID=2493646 RepID=A0AAE0RY18_9BIVA|nr:hypothetical protein CHS0354_007229 [Potamilus streckersoni]
MAYNEKCFKIVETEASWAEAVIYCKEYGATLGTIDNVGEQNFLENYIRSANTVTNQSFNTGDDYVYHYLRDLGIDITGHSSITFSVQACNDAHVALSQTKGNDNVDTYEIVIGGWADSQSVIRDCKQCDNKDEAHHR